MLKKLLAPALLALAASAAQAELYNVDAFTEGDLAGAYVDTLDILWLDLKPNFNRSFADARTIYPDYRLASNTEVETLFKAAFPSLASSEVNYRHTNLTPELSASMLNWADALGYANGSANYSYGRYYDENGVIRTLGIRNENQSFSSWFIAGTSYTSSYNDAASGAHSVFLVKDLDSASLTHVRSQAGISAADVPIVGVGALSLLALAGLRRQRNA